MNRKFLNFILLASMISLLAGCNESLIGEEKKQAPPYVPLSLKTNIVTKENTNDLRNGPGAIDQIPDRHSIGIILSTSSNGFVSYTDNSNDCFNIETKLSNYNWEFSKDIFLSDKNGYVFSYYPFTTSFISDSRGVCFLVDHTTQIDYLYGKHSGTTSFVNRNNSEANIKFNHAQALLRFRFKRGTYTSDGMVQKIAVGLHPHYPSPSGFYSIGFLNVITGRIEPSIPNVWLSAGIEDTYNGLIPFRLGTNFTPDEFVPKILVLPQENIFGKAIYLDITIDNKSFITRLNYSGDWEAGKAYTYDITVNNSSLAIGAASVNSWQDADTGNTVIISY